MLRKILVLLILLSLLYTAMPNNNTNILLFKTEIDSIQLTSLPEDQLNKLFDGVASTKPEFSITSTPDKTENIIIKLKHPFYLRQIRVGLGQGEHKVTVRYSKDGIFWFELDQPTKTTRGQTSIYQFNGENVLASFVAFIFVPQKETALNIQEIEIYPEMDIRLRSRHIKDSWLISDREAFNDIDTKIDTIRYLQYGEISLPKENRFKTPALPVLDGEALSLGNLKPGTAYEYKLSITDYNGNILEVEPRPLNTKPLSLAYNKPMIDGTFTKKYDGSTLPSNNTVLTDGSTNLDNSFAMSGSVKNAEQFLVIDLGEPKDVSEIITLWRALGYSKDFTILGSIDNINWNKIAEKQNAALGLSGRSAEGHPLKVLSSKFPKTKLRYLKLLMAQGSDHYNKHGTGQLELFEVKAF